MCNHGLRTFHAIVIIRETTTGLPCSPKFTAIISLAFVFDSQVEGADVVQINHTVNSDMATLHGRSCVPLNLSVRAYDESVRLLDKGVDLLSLLERGDQNVSVIHPELGVFGLYNKPTEELVSYLFSDLFLPLSTSIVVFVGMWPSSIGRKRRPVLISLVFVPAEPLRFWLPFSATGVTLLLATFYG